MKSDIQETVVYTPRQLHPAIVNRRIFLAVLSMHVGLIMGLWYDQGVSLLKSIVVTYNIPVDRYFTIGDVAFWVVLLSAMKLLFMIERSSLNRTIKLRIFSTSILGLTLLGLISNEVAWYIWIPSLIFWAGVGLIYSRIELWWKARKQQV